jgi:hypothetical protein
VTDPNAGPLTTNPWSAKVKVWADDQGLARAKHLGHHAEGRHLHPGTRLRRRARHDQGHHSEIPAKPGQPQIPSETRPQSPTKRTRRLQHHRPPLLPQRRNRNRHLPGPPPRPSPIQIQVPRLENGQRKPTTGVVTIGTPLVIGFTSNATLTSAQVQGEEKGFRGPLTQDPDKFNYPPGGLRPGPNGEPHCHRNRPGLGSPPSSVTFLVVGQGGAPESSRTKPPA